MPGVGKPGPSATRLRAFGRRRRPGGAGVAVERAVGVGGEPLAVVGEGRRGRPEAAWGAG
eukprot:5669628-Pyramimonas_sp.AAC.1